MGDNLTCTADWIDCVQNNENRAIAVRVLLFFTYYFDHAAKFCVDVRFHTLTLHHPLPITPSLGVGAEFHPLPQDLMSPPPSPPP